MQAHPIRIKINYYNSIGYEKGKDGKYIKNQRGRYVFNKSTLKFENHLREMKIRVISKPLKFISGNESIASNKLDGDIMIEALLDQHKWDKLILMSGDSDFERLVKEISALSKPVHIFSFSSRISHELKMLSFKSNFVTYSKLESMRKIFQKTKNLTKCLT